MVKGKLIRAYNA